MLRQNFSRFIGTSFVAAGLSLACLTARAESPIPIATVAPVGDLTAEAQATITNIEKALESEETYAQNAKVWKQGASLLAVIAQGIVEHPDATPLKSVAPSLRDGAIQVATSKNFAEAQAGWKVIAAAKAGTSAADAKADFNWAKLTKLHPSMEEMNSRGAAVRRSLKRLRKPEEEARDATAIALLAVSTFADTHEVKNAEDKPYWEELSRNFQKEMTETATAMRNKDVEKAKAVFAEGMKRCEACHEKFCNE